MARAIVSLLAACPMMAAIYPVGAVTTSVRVPTQYDGSWRIVATTEQGPCSASKSYQVEIKGSYASIPNQEVGIAGGVSAGGIVQATITQGSASVPITGRLDLQGRGNGTWRTSGGLVACSGTWDAMRLG